MRSIIRQWRTIIKHLANEAINSPVADTGEPGALNGHDPAATVSVSMEKKAWYVVEPIPRADVMPGANPDAIVSLLHACQICATQYRVGVKVWKIRSCWYAGTSCPSCKTFQTIDLDEVRRHYGARIPARARA